MNELQKQINYLSSEKLKERIKLKQLEQQEKNRNIRNEMLT